jgi:hypothetical protein
MVCPFATDWLPSPSLQGILPLLFGFWFFVFASKHSSSAVKWHSKLWGFSGTRRQYEIGFRVFGALAMIFGVLVLTGTIRLP